MWGIRFEYHHLIACPLRVCLFPFASVFPSNTTTSSLQLPTFNEISPQHSTIRKTKPPITMSDSESTDERTFIEPLQLKHDGEPFTYKWELEYKGHSYDNRNVANWLPLKEPLRTKAGKIAARQPQPPPKQPHMWWKAQCVFRGLGSKGTMVELQNKLRGHENDGMVVQLRELEKTTRRSIRGRIYWRGGNMMRRQDASWMSSGRVVS